MTALHVEVSGTGPDLVLLHGLGVNLRVWDGLVKALCGRFRVITLDLPGHGRSPSGPAGTPAERSWLVHQTLSGLTNHYSLLGWSLGGQIALDLAAAVPGQIGRIVLVGTTAKFVAAPDWPHGMPAAAMAALATKLRADCQRTVHDFIDLQARGSARGDHVRVQLHSALSIHGEADAQALDRALESLAQSDLRAALGHVRSPALVVSGQYDRITPPAASRALARALPDARYVELRRASHAPFLSHESTFCRLLERFLRPRAARTPRKAKAHKAARPKKPLRPAPKAGRRLSRMSAVKRKVRRRTRRARARGR